MSIVATEPIQTPTQRQVARPQISAMRKLLVKRFPSLTFAVRTNGVPLYEVLLATDRALFDAANASRRTPSNFYSSRQDGGLRASSGPDEIYLVPSAVLRGFAAAVPKPSAIYYTAVTYATPDGGTPTFAQSPESLALTAPSVTVAPDFTGDTLSRSLSLRGAPRHLALAADIAPAAAVTPTAPPPTALPTPAAPLDPAADAGAGEDGYSVLAAHPDQAAAPAPTPAPPPVAAAPARAAPVAPASPPVSQEPVPQQPVSQQPYDDGYDGYDDGWGSGNGNGSHAIAQDAAFPQGFGEPTQLVDEDDDASGALATWAPAPSTASALSGIDDSYPYRQLDEPVSAAPVDAPPPAPAPPVAPPAAPSLPQLQLTVADKKAIVERIAGAESGSDRYGAINADGEFKGRFGPSHPATGHHHIGLSYGIVQFTQDSGNLGRLLTMMRDRDGETFRQVFGPDADELVRVTTADGPRASECEGGRSARTQPVGGADLWEQPWIDRFRAAGKVESFQAAQNELAASGFVDPMLPFCGNLGLDTDRALTMAVDRAVQMGVGGARHWIAAATGPISTPALRQQALAALGFADVAGFQRAYGQQPDNLWGPVTHAALVGALRALGAASPVPLPTVDQMLDALVRRAEGDSVLWVDRVRRLRTATDFTDRPYAR
jgi:hypothetical protein